MKSIVKTIFGTIIGIMIGFFVLSLFETLSSKWYPSTHMNPTNAERIKDIEAMPLPGFLLILGGFILASFMGGYVAARISPDDKKILAAFCVGFFYLLGGIVLFMSLPYPIWLSISTGISFILFTYIGGRLAKR